MEAGKSATSWTRFSDRVRATAAEPLEKAVIKATSGDRDLLPPKEKHVRTLLLALGDGDGRAAAAAAPVVLAALLQVPPAPIRALGRLRFTYVVRYRY